MSTLGNAYAHTQIYAHTQLAIWWEPTVHSVFQNNRKNSPSFFRFFFYLPAFNSKTTDISFDGIFPCHTHPLFTCSHSLRYRLIESKQLRKYISTQQCLTHISTCILWTLRFSIRPSKIRTSHILTRNKEQYTTTDSRKSCATKRSHNNSYMLNAFNNIIILSTL